jgi:hypothetical protein
MAAREGRRRSAVPFDAWAAAAREQLAAQARRSAEAAVETAMATHDHATALRVARRWAGWNPADGRAALGLMRALAAAGDVAGALQHFGVHTAAAAGQPVDPDVAAYAAHLMAPPADAPAVVESEQPSGAPAATAAPGLAPDQMETSAAGSAVAPGTPSLDAPSAGFSAAGTDWTSDPAPATPVTGPVSGDRHASGYSRVRLRSPAVRIVLALVVALVAWIGWRVWSDGREYSAAQGSLLVDAVRDVRVGACSGSTTALTTPATSDARSRRLGSWWT